MERLKRKYHGAVDLLIVRHKNVNPKNPKQAIPTPVRFKFFRDRRTGKIHYRKFYVLDIRWWRKPWQKKALPPSVLYNVKEAPVLFAGKFPRQVGKTYLTSRSMAGLILFREDVEYPVTRFFNLEKGQARTNTLESLKKSIAMLPHATYSNTDALVTIPCPQIGLEDRVGHFAVLGAKGGFKFKVGATCIGSVVDEADLFELKFVEKAGILTTVYVNGLNMILGTQEDDGEVLNFYKRKALKMIRIREEIKKGTWRGEIPASVDYWHYLEVTGSGMSEGDGVYSKTKQKILKEMLTAETYAEAIENKSITAHKRYYYQHILDSLDFDRRNMVDNLEPNPTTPMFAFYDIGIGDKSDRMAVALVQFMVGRIYLYYADDLQNGTLHEIVNMAYQGLSKFSYPHGIYRHVLPHDAKQRNGLLINSLNIVEEYLKSMHINPESVIAGERTPDRKIDEDLVKKFLPTMSVHAVYGEPMIHALTYHRRQEMPKGSGTYIDKPSKTKHRDLESVMRGICRFYQTEKYFEGPHTIFGNAETPNYSKDIHIDTGIPHPMKNSIIHPPQQGGLEIMDIVG